MKWVKKEQNSHFKSITSITSKSIRHQPGTRLRQAHTTTPMHVQVFISGRQALPSSFCRLQRRTVTGLRWACTYLRLSCDRRPRTQRVKCVFKKPGIIMTWQRFLNSCNCYRRSLTPSYLKLPSFSVIGESQSAVEDNNLPSITILPTLVWLHKLSLSCINQELKPRRCGINQQTLARPLHFSGNEDTFIIKSHSA